MRELSYGAGTGRSYSLRGQGLPMGDFGPMEFGAFWRFPSREGPALDSRMRPHELSDAPPFWRQRTRLAGNDRRAA